MSTRATALEHTDPTPAGDGFPTGGALTLAPARVLGVDGPRGNESAAPAIVFRVGCWCGWRSYRRFRALEAGWVGSGRPCPHCGSAVERRYRKGEWPGRHQATEVVYLLHYEVAIGGARPQDRAQHYLGSARAAYLQARLSDQRDGRGANLPRVMAERGIPFVCVRTWPGGRELERRIKRGGHGPRQCPLCNPNAHRRYVVPGGWIFGRDDAVAALSLAS